MIYAIVVSIASCLSLWIWSLCTAYKMDQMQEEIDRLNFIVNKLDWRLNRGYKYDLKSDK